MRSKIRRFICLILTPAMVFTLFSSTEIVAYAKVDTPAPLADHAHSTAAVYVSGGARVSDNEYKAGEVTIATAKGADGVSGNSADGVLLTSKYYEATGIVVADGSYTLGGDKNYYTVYSSRDHDNVGTTITGGRNKIGSFNSVLLFGLDGAVNSSATIGSSGVDVGNDANLNINNVYMQVDGARRYVASNYKNGKMIVNDSYLVSTGNADGKTGDINLPFSNEHLLISGSARTNFSNNASDTYYFNSAVIAEGWAALSTDSATGDGLDLHAYNTTAKVLNGGYATYADTNCRVWLYGSNLESAEIGGIISKSGSITVTDGASADSSVTQYNTGKTTKKGTIITGGRNALMLHAPDMMGEGVKAADTGTLNVSNSTLATSKSLVSTYDYSNYSDAIAAYVNYVSGDDILVKSTSANISLNNTTMNSYNGILVHTVLNSDSMGNFIAAGDNASVNPVSVSMTDMNVEGDMVHDDYQRDMKVDLTQTTLTGAIVKGTYNSWNKRWSAYGLDAASWTPNSSWSGTNNLSVTVDKDSIWNVTKKSTVSKLTIEKGAVINAVLTVDGVKKDIAAGTYEGNVMLTPASNSTVVDIEDLAIVAQPS
jgi:hypothetical protein